MSTYFVHFNDMFFSIFLASYSDLLLSCGFLFLFLFLPPVSFDLTFVTVLSNSFILFFIFLTFFPMPLLSSSATLNFKILLNLCHIVMLCFFNQVLAIDHTILVVILIIEVRTIDDLKFQMMRIFFNFFNFYQSQ